jgi:hypothetical protein
VNEILAALGGPLAVLVLAVIGVVITKTIITVGKYLRTRVSADVLDILSQVADAAVKAAEQDPAVQDKKQSALNAAAALLSDLGIEVSAEALDAAIEKAVMEAFNYDYENSTVSEAFFEKRFQAAKADA